MGMFDWVRCDAPLPTPAAQGLQFQSKDLECGLDHYIITAAGRLVRLTWDWEDIPLTESPGRLRPACRRVPGSEQRIDMTWNGLLTFYGDAHTGEVAAIRMSDGEDILHPGPPPPWYEFTALFADGQLQRIDVAPES